MSMLLKASLTAGALGFVAYCFYFDNKRRSDPDFRAKLKEKRAKNKKSKSKGADYIPAFTNSEDMAKFFSEEVQLGDDLLQIGKFEEAAFHLGNAAVVCAQKKQFLEALQRSLPSPIFQLVMGYYQIANEAFMAKVFQQSNLAELFGIPVKTKDGFIDENDIE